MDQIELIENPYVNRELSWLNFNLRVLHEASNHNNPLLERLRFLAITDKNLTEFYMVRVAGLKEKLKKNISKKSICGMNAEQQLQKITPKVRNLISDQIRVWEELKIELKENDIEILDSFETLSKQELKWLDKHFVKNIFPVLTPISIDPSHPFPIIKSNAFAMIFKLENETKELNSLIVLPENINRFINLEAEDKRFIALELVIRKHFDKLFPGFSLKDSGIFHILRNSDIKIEEDIDIDEVDDLVATFKDALNKSKQAALTRLMVNHDISEDLLSFLKKSLNANKDDIFYMDSLMNFSDIDEFCKLKKPNLLFKKYTPRFPLGIESSGTNYFSAIKSRDILIHHPYETFDTVIQFLMQAASDPDVIAIKQTLYRSPVDSPIVKSLITAAENGKSVTAVIELKARFNEHTNIQLSEALLKAGVQIVFGFLEYKTHCKISMVARKEKDQIVNYVHFGTGNYHPINAKIYTDLSLFTADEAFGRDVTKVFNYLTGYAEPENLEKVVIAPLNLKAKIIFLIEQEIKIAKEGGEACIWAKMNSLVDKDVIDALYRASQAGVKISLVVRGICCLRPGLKNLSENIEVKSIIGRFLEHSRIMCFGNGAKLPNENALIYISSSDWMTRNFHRRVETLIPIENKIVRKQVLEQVMQKNLCDDQLSWSMKADNSYEKNLGSNFNVHNFFMDAIKE